MSPPPGQGYGYGYGYPPVMVHKPGVVALRPLGLGDLYDGAFKTIRRNPAAMVGMAAVVTTAFLVIPVVVTLALAVSGELASSVADPAAADGTGVVATGLARFLGPAFGLFATALLGGVVVHVVSEAVLGRTTSMASAWRAVRGRVPRLVGLVLLNALLVALTVAVPVALGLVVGLQGGWGPGLLLGGPVLFLALLALAFVEVRFFLLAPAVLVLERTSILAALRRAGRLSRRQWWRLFGIQLLTALLVGLVSEVISVPFGLLGALGAVGLSGTGGALALVFASYLSQVVVGTLTTPFTASVTALQYVDQRIRKEALDVQLIAASQRQAGPTR